MPATASRMSTLARAVAALLGADWHAAPDDHHTASYIFRHRDGRMFSLAAEVYGPQPDRLHADTVLPRTSEDIPNLYTDDIKRTRISMAGTKSAEQIERDISRRLLPGVDAAYETWRARLEHRRREEGLRRSVADELASLPGISAPSRMRASRPYETAWRMSWSPEGTPSHTDFRLRPFGEVAVDACEDGHHVTINARGLSVRQGVSQALNDEPRYPEGPGGLKRPPQVRPYRTLALKQSAAGAGFRAPCGPPARSVAHGFCASGGGLTPRGAAGPSRSGARRRGSGERDAGGVPSGRPPLRTLPGNPRKPPPQAPAAPGERRAHRERRPTGGNPTRSGHTQRNQVPPLLTCTHLAPWRQLMYCCSC